MTIRRRAPGSMIEELLYLLNEPVIIIDEYDSPIVEAISKGNMELANEMSTVFNLFYSSVKIP